ncbi:MAG TPA: SUMF1/EgtB/PvdO family nonheme iron enzyme [Candidatus Binatia bacterium]|nr:SUMF1/EgtB/PvdO family nonheme iron enzyme [Candidatus Binatia bacterium]
MVGTRQFIAIVFACVIAAVSHAGEAPDMVRIPAGSFWMGNENGPADEKPRHQVNVAEFFIDRTKVTNAQFAGFMNANGTQAADGQRWYDSDDNDARIHRRNNQWAADPGHENHPVVEASWYGALAYCRWLGKRLPTEAEWEKAARGTDGRKFPWGNDPPDKSRAHFGGGWNELKPVGSFPQGASPYGVFDMAGNGWEWVSSAYLPYPYDVTDGREDLMRDVVRGTRGGGHDSRPEEITTTQRGRQVSRNPRGGHHNISFRCAR